MEAKELRIGNLIHQKDIDYDSDGLMFFDGELTETYVNADILDEMELDLHFRPIPLTEEWLIRFGFNDNLLKKIGDTDLFIQGDSKESINEFGVYLSTDIGYGKDTYPNTHIEIYKYVHQLQNLYFALTGEEIEVVE